MFRLDLLTGLDMSSIGRARSPLRARLVNDSESAVKGLTALPGCSIAEHIMESSSDSQPWAHDVIPSG